MKKIMFLMTIMSMLILLMTGNVNATQACEIIEPDTGDPVRDGTIFNVSFSGFTNVSVSVYINISSSSTANSSTSTLFVLTNKTTNGAVPNTTNASLGSTIAVEDAQNYQVTAYADNGTTIGQRITCTGTATNVIFDRTVPNVPTTSHTAGQVFGATTLTYNVIGANTTGCRISFGRVGQFTGSNTYAMTHSGNTCTYAITSGNPPDGVYDVQVRASDGSNTSVSSVLDFKIDILEEDTPDIGDGLQVDVGRAVANKKNVLLAILIVVGVYALSNKKK